MVGSKSINILVLLVIIVVLPLIVFISQKRQDIRQKAQENVLSNGYTQESLDALGMHKLSSDEFAVIKQEGENVSGEKIKTYFRFENGREYEIETDKTTFASIIQGDKTKTFISKNPDIEIHNYSELSTNNEKIDPQIYSKLEKSETAKVIVEMKVSYNKFLEPNQSEESIVSKKEKFNIAVSEIKKSFKGESRANKELPIVNALAAEVDKNSLGALSENTFVQKISLDRPVKIALDTSLSEINARYLWPLSGQNNIPITGQGKTIAVIDTGVNYKSADLGGCLGSTCRVIGGYDFVNNDTDPMDDNGHGTHVAAIAAGNGVLQGVAKDAKILAYKVLGQDGAGYMSDIIMAIQRAADPNEDGNTQDHADVINMSIGGSGNPDDLENQAIDNATSLGVLSVVAAGNNGPNASTISSPGTARTALTVAASCKSFQTGISSSCVSAIADFSSRGPLIWQGQDLKKPDISAPGVAICSSIPFDKSLSYPFCFDGNHKRLSGTSMATPHVSGGALLLRQIYPNYTPLQIKQLIKETARDLGANQAYNNQGAGVIDLKKAVPKSTNLIYSSDLWEFSSDPTRKINYFAKTFTVTPQVLDINSLSINFKGASLGISISSNKQLLQVSNKTTDSFSVAVAIDNDLVKAGYYSIAMELSENGQKKGIIPVIINVKPTITTGSLELIDYGVDDPGLANWTSDTKTINITNLRTDKSQVVNILPFFSSGISLSINSQNITIPPGGTSSVSTNLNANNSQVPNSFYSGALTINNSTNSIALSAKFVKYYVLTIQDTGSDVAKSITSALLHNKVNETFFKTNRNSTSLTFYLDKGGVYDSIINYKSLANTPDSISSYTVVKENILINKGITLVYVSRNEAKNKIETIPTDFTGNIVKPLKAGFYSFNYIPGNILYTGLQLDPNVDVSVHYVSDFSNNYRYSSYYNSLPLQPASYIYYFYGSVTGLNNNIAFRNTPSDFKKIDLQVDPDQQSGAIRPVIYNCFPFIQKECSAFSSNTNSLNIPAVETIYSLAPDDSYYYQKFGDWGSEQGLSSFFTVSSSLERWLNKQSKINILPIAKERKIYNGLGPSFFSAKFQNSNKTISIYPYDSNTFSPKTAFLRQDFSLKKYSALQYSIYKSGYFLTSRSLPQFNPEYNIENPLIDSVNIDGLIDAASLSEAEKYEVKIDFPYKNKGIDLTGKVKASFDIALSDPNPPAIKYLYYYTQGSRSEVYDPKYSNKIEFGIDPVGGSISMVNASYSLPGQNLQPLSVNGSDGSYYINLPQSAGSAQKISVSITAADNSNNSLNYILEMPVGNFTVFPTLTPQPTLNPTPGLSLTKLEVTILPDGVNLNPVYNPRAKSFTVRVLNSSNQLVKSVNQNIQFARGTGFKGQIDLGDLPTGIYTFKFKTKGYLRAAVVSYKIASGIVNTIPPITLFSGDINTDGQSFNKVDGSDYSSGTVSYLACYGKTTTICLNNADLNLDRKIDNADYSLLMSNWEKTGQ